MIDKHRARGAAVDEEERLGLVEDGAESSGEVCEVVGVDEAKPGFGDGAESGEGFGGEVKEDEDVEICGNVWWFFGFFFTIGGEGRRRGKAAAAAAEAEA